MTGENRDARILQLVRVPITAIHGNWYHLSMSKKLSTTNPYLRDPVVRNRMVLKSVASSSAIEGIRAPFKKASEKSELAPGASRKKKAA